MQKAHLGTTSDTRLFSAGEKRTSRFKRVDGRGRALPLAPVIGAGAPTCPCRKPYPAWQSIENRTMIVRNEGSLQAHWLDGCRSDPVAGNARGRDLDVAAADQRSAANCSKETLLLRRRPNDIRWSLSVVP